VDAGKDAEALVATRRDAEAFAGFYRRHNQRVLRYFATRTPSPETAADLTAETFATAFASVHRFDPGRGPAVAWLFAIAHNLLLDAYRRGEVRAKARRRLAFEPLWLDDDDLRRIEELASTPSVAQLLDGLGEAERAAVRARVIEERSYDEIARDLRCSPQVVRQRVSRGLGRIRTIMGDEA
jgi:RNA polymerase sigma-70 factor (ECF subfamily)